LFIPLFLTLCLFFLLLSFCFIYNCLYPFFLLFAFFSFSHHSASSTIVNHFLFLPFTPLSSFIILLHP
jgi:hypothetical protein